MESIVHVPGFELSSTLQNVTGTAPALRIDVVVNNPQELSLLLDEAVQRLIPTALEHRQGILVTQIFSDTYAVEVDETVSCGVTQEKRITPGT
jgi:hypothetical protein